MNDRTGARGLVASQTAANAEQLLIGTWNNGVNHTWENDGTYTFDGSRLTVITNPGPIHCRANTTGQYVVTFEDADTVSMEAIDDECLARIDVFTNAPWARVTELSSNG
jgi:hypothetical protein